MHAALLLLLFAGPTPSVEDVSIPDDPAMASEGSGSEGSGSEGFDFEDDDDDNAAGPPKPKSPKGCRQSDLSGLPALLPVLMLLRRRPR